MSDPIAALFDLGATRELGHNAPLFFVGDPVVEVFLVRAGQVGLRRVSEDGVEMYLQTARCGEVIAEGSVYSDCYHCDGVAMRPSRVAVLPRERFRDRLRQDARLMELWAARLAHAVQAARLRAEIRGLRTVAGRLNAWLELQGGLPPRGRWQEVAAELGVSREALYRELSRRRGASR